MASGVKTGGRKKGSRNKAGRDLREICQRYTEESVAQLACVMRDEGSPAMAIVSAAIALLDRGHGKPRQGMDLEVGKLTLEQLVLGAIAKRPE